MKPPPTPVHFRLLTAESALLEKMETFFLSYIPNVESRKLLRNPAYKTLVMLDGNADDAHEEPVVLGGTCFRPWYDDAAEPGFGEVSTHAQIFSRRVCTAVCERPAHRSPCSRSTTRSAAVGSARG